MSTNTMSKTNSYLSFRIDEEVYAAHVSKVVSILELTKIMKIPRSKEYIRGVINLRGSVLPIVDVKIKFGLEPTEFTANTCILVLEIQMEDKLAKIGALVDSVEEVLEIDEADVLAPPSLGKNYRAEFIDGMYKLDNSFIMLLNMESIFSSDEISFMSSEMLFDEEPKMIEKDK